MATDLADNRHIREELQTYSDEAWSAGRQLLILKMLARMSIYTTPHIRERFEVAVQANLEAELEHYA